MKFKHVIFDFDGVLVESNEIRFGGFRMLLKDYPGAQVEKLMRHARANGGLSRYDRIRYFFETIRNESISENKVLEMAGRYSEIVKDKIIGCAPVNGSVEFLSSHCKEFDFAVVSGSDQSELRDICRARGIDRYFTEILGSPAVKSENISLLFTLNKWKKDESVFVGDSTNDFDGAKACGIAFIGRNSGLVKWKTMKGIVNIDDLSQLYAHLV